MSKRVGVGFVGDGFIAHFHAQSWINVRDGDIVAVTSRREEKGHEFAEHCRSLMLVIRQYILMLGKWLDKAM